LVADLSHWLETRGLGVEDLDEERIAEALEHLPRGREFLRCYQAVFGTLLEYLCFAKTNSASRINDLREVHGTYSVNPSPPLLSP
jgi:hypothetical protein